MTRTGKNCCEVQIDKRAGQSRFQRSTATVPKGARKTHNPSVVGSSPTCPTMNTCGLTCGNGHFKPSWITDIWLPGSSCGCSSLRHIPVRGGSCLAIELDFWSGHGSGRRVVEGDTGAGDSAAGQSLCRPLPDQLGSAGQCALHVRVVLGGAAAVLDGPRDRDVLGGLRAG